MHHFTIKIICCLTFNFCSIIFNKGKHHLETNIFNRVLIQNQDSVPWVMYTSLCDVCHLYSMQLE